MHQESFTPLDYFARLGFVSLCELLTQCFRETILHANCAGFLPNSFSFMDIRNF